MSDPRVHLISLGCPKNTVDSERMLGLLRGNDYALTGDPEEADVVIVNTCGFIEPAKEESIDTILAAGRLKDSGRCKGVVVTGCLSTRYEEELKAELAGEADVVLTLREERDIVRHVDRLLGRGRGHYVDRLPRTSLTPRHWAYLRISDGCDHKCAFCAIPSIRGRHVSEPVEELVAEAERLAQAGVRELVLVAQDSVRYGADLYGRPRLVPLLEQLAEVEGIEWLRLMYTYPAFWTGGDARLLRRPPEDVPLRGHAPAAHRRPGAAAHEAGHHPAQDPRPAGPPAAAHARRRPALLLHRRLPRRDGRAQFEELLAFIETTRFDNAACFLYSDEEGTPAFELDGKLPAHVIAERYRRLTQLQERVSAAINHDMVGSRRAMLIDSASGGRIAGRLERDAPEIDGQVVLEAPRDEGLTPIEGAAPAGAPRGERLVGRFAEVEITGAHAYELEARLAGRVW